MKTHADEGKETFWTSRKLFCTNLDFCWHYRRNPLSVLPPKPPPGPTWQRDRDQSEVKIRTALRQLLSHCCSLKRLRKLATRHVGAVMPAHTLLSRYWGDGGGGRRVGHPSGAPQSPDTLHRSRPHCCSSVASVHTLVKGFLQGFSTERSTSRRSLTKDSAMQDEAISSAAARHVYIWLRAGWEDPAGASAVETRSEHQVLGAEKHPVCLINTAPNNLRAVEAFHSG